MNLRDKSESWWWRDVAKVVGKDSEVTATK